MDRFSATRILVQHRYILIPIECECECTGDWCRWHIESMWDERSIESIVRDERRIFFECLSLFHSESMLLIDDDESKTRKPYSFLNQRMSPKYDFDVSSSYTLSYSFFLFRCEWTDENITRYVILFEELPWTLKVLLCEDFCRYHDSDLRSHRRSIFSRSYDHMYRHEEHHDRLPRSDISLEEARHSMRFFHVFHDLKEDDLLFVCERKWEVGYELLHEISIECDLKCFSGGAFDMFILSSESEKLKMEEFLIPELTLSALEILSWMRSMKCENILFPRSESSTLSEWLWNIWVEKMRKVFTHSCLEKMEEELHLLPDPDSWNIIQVRIDWTYLLTFFMKMFYIGREERKSSVLILRFSENDDFISTLKLFHNDTTIEPYALSVIPITVDDDSLYEHFPISRSFFCQYFDTRMEGLFFAHIEECELGKYIGSVFVRSRVESEKIFRRWYPDFWKFFYIYVCRMKERFCELHSGTIWWNSSFSSKKKILALSFSWSMKVRKKNISKV